MSQKIDFIDLKSQYRALKDAINSRIQKVLDHGQYIMGPEVRELELRWKHIPGLNIALPLQAVQRRS